MSTQTANIGLHQWESTDNFLREDFNEDNRKIDAAIQQATDKSAQAAEQLSTRLDTAIGQISDRLDTEIKQLTTKLDTEIGQVSAKVDRAMAGLEAASYNIYNLLLQNYYDSKYTGYKKSIIFDGFMDAGMIQSKSASITLHSNRLTVNAAGQGNLVIEAGSNWIQSGNSPTITSSGGGNVYGIVVSFLNETSSKQAVPCNVYCSGSQVASFSFQVPTGATQQTHTLSKEFSIAKGDQLSIQLSGLNNEVMAKGGKTSIYQLAVTFLCRASSGATGQMSTVSFALPEGTAQLWLRHKDCSITPSLNGADGKHLPLSASGTRSAWNLQREACTETVFTLSQLCQKGTYTLSMNITRTGQSDGFVYDYGLICT